ncbi:MAG: YraN family protein [Nitrospiraceae bacterium]
MKRVGRTIGQAAESEAARFLRRKGYRILERNARSVFGELDLVAQRNGTLVFVEVKARRSSAYGGAPHAVDARKQARLVRLAAVYLARHGLRNQSCRFDVILCAGDGPSPKVTQHIENAFEVPGEDARW